MKEGQLLNRREHRGERTGGDQGLGSVSGIFRTQKNTDRWKGCVPRQSQVTFEGLCRRNTPGPRRQMGELEVLAGARRRGVKTGNRDMRQCHQLDGSSHSGGTDAKIRGGQIFRAPCPKITSNNHRSHV